MDDERTIVITGATDGLGRQLARRLAREQATHLILHGRSEERLRALERELADAPATVTTVRADLSDLVAVRRLGYEIADIAPRINVLVNNAGVGSGEPDGRERRLTSQGNELRFAVNYLAPFTLTLRLLPRLDAGAPSRIVNVASIGQARIDLDDLTFAQGYDGQRAYARSKLALVMFTFSLSERLDPARTTVNCLHPGTYMPTKMVVENGTPVVDTLETGTDATLRLIEDPTLVGVSGRFYERQQEAKARPQAYEPEARQRLWELSEKLTGAAE